MGKHKTRNEVYELYAKLYRSSSVDKDYIVRALKLQLEQVKEKLVAAGDFNTTLQLQGEAKALDKIITQLTTAPLNE